MSEHLKWKKSKSAGRGLSRIPSEDVEEAKGKIQSEDEGRDRELAIKKYYSIAEKIVEGLLKAKFIVEENRRGYWEVIFSKFPSKDTFIKAIAEAILKNLTYGNLGTLTLRNNRGQIVAKLYILPDGTLADDSWLCNEGWK